MFYIPSSTFKVSNTDVVELSHQYIVSIIGRFNVQPKIRALIGSFPRHRQYSNLW